MKSKFAFCRLFSHFCTRSSLICLVLLLPLFSIYQFSFSFAQKFGFGESDPWTISASNQLEYSLDRKTHQDIFHNWTDLDLSHGIYTVNLRYEAHQPDDWGRTWQKLSFRNLQLSSEFLEITAGNYYVIFGRGLILRSYENRDLRYDNNLDGVKGTIDLDGFDLTMLGGTALGKYERLSDPLHAVDGKIAFTDWMNLGGSYLRTHITDFGLVRLFGGNVSMNFPHVDFYAEYAKKDNPPGKYIPKDGKGIYLSTNVYTAGMGLALEYKEYDKFDFINQDVTFNNPPPLAREHMYTLLNRHAYVLDLIDEKGFQAEITSSPFNLLSLLANYSYTTNRKNEVLFSEIYGELEYDYKDMATLKGGFSRQENRQEVGSPIRLAPVVDVIYYVSEANSINFILEHLYTDKYDGKLSYYDQILSLSLSHSPTVSLTLTHERTTEWKIREDWPGKRNWLIATLDLAMGENHNLSLSVGSRREGKVCAGGVCVDKPALDGFEIKLLSRF
ncbi:MAG: hypothetical protein AMJ91_01105 [candidate division Zixibacteria bacterium SM23_73_3]|nr:MAG: hypothetical protein AMJ91_01105 [candidate division Zixibacteria bacterium SM23_73_3]